MLAQLATKTSISTVVQNLAKLKVSEKHKHGANQNQNPINHYTHSFDQSHF